MCLWERARTDEVACNVSASSAVLSWYQWPLPAGSHSPGPASRPPRLWPGVWRRACRAHGRDRRCGAGEWREVIGVIPESMVARELAHTGPQRLQVVPGMHARKARMAELADAFIALPGGYGTLRNCSK